jgi:WD40 repeat protein
MHHFPKRALRAGLFSAIVVLGQLTVAQTGEPSSQPVLRIEASAHTAPIKRIAVDAANRYFVTGSDDKTARVWELKTGRLLRILRPPIGNNHAGQIFAVAISPDGETVAAGGWTTNEGTINAIYLFDRASGALIRLLEGLQGVISHLAYSRDGKYLVAALGGNAGIRIYETTGYGMVASDTGYGGDSYGADFDAKGRLVTSCFDGFIRLYQLEARGALRLLSKANPTGGRLPHTVKFSPDGSKVAVGVYDITKVAVLSGQTLSPLYFPSVNSVASFAIEWSADGEKLFASTWLGGSNFAIRSWERAGQGRFQDTPTAADTVMDIQALNDGGVLYCSGDPLIGMVDAAGRKSLFTAATIANFKGTGTDLLLSHDGSIVQFRFDPESRSPVRFSLNDRRLDPSPAPLSLIPPITRVDNFVITEWASSFSPKINGIPLQLEPNELSTSLAMLPSRQGFVLGTAFALKFFDNRGTPAGQIRLPAVAWGVNLSGDGRYVVAALGDGTIRWYSMLDGQERLAFFPHSERRRWVVWTPSGYYDASPGAEDLIGWHVNNGRAAAADFFPVGQFREVYYRPDVVSLMLQTGDERLAIKEANERAGRKSQQSAGLATMLPPVVEILSPSDGTAVSSSEVTVRFRVRTPTAEPVTRVKTLVEGRPTGERQLVQEAAQASGERQLTVSVPPRDTEISIIAENRFAASVPATVRVRWSGTANNEAFVIQPKLYVLAVGVSQYANPNYSLGFAAKDAQDFAAAMSNQKGLLYRDVIVKVLADAAATKDEILDSLDWIRKETTSKDVAMVFFAGHGINDQNGSYYFLPHNTDVQRLLRTGVPFTDIRTTVQSLAGKTLFFIDTCHSGNVLGDTRRRDLASDLNGVINELASAENGAVVFAASTGNQYSLENETWNNGAFTKALVEGINGRADYTGKGKITINMLDLYLSERVKELTGGRQTPTTAKPRTVPDFPVAVRR